MSITKKTFCCAVQGKPVYIGDPVYDIKEKRFIHAASIEIINDHVYVVGDTGNKAYIENCVIFNDPSMKALPHIDEWIDSISSFKTMNEMENYAKLFFLLHRLPAVLYLAFLPWIKQFELYCTYKNERYRVTGCSRMGDIWLTKDYKLESGYDLRVNVSEVMNFGDKL